ncbi:MAG TPA: MgtC/SapB family protein [Sporichthyaceae bacterium]|nr:MgtC/SapB family protein [Sporichthyaceae bacterium]
MAELLLAFGLGSLIGLEREFRGKSAGLRTQTIVATAAALVLLVSKYGFGDVLHPGTVVLDPSRVAAQIVSGIGFLGAGLILTRRGAVRGLTTAAAVWETAAIGMAAGAGLPLLAIVVTGLHFLVVFGYTGLLRRSARHQVVVVRLAVHYRDGQGVLGRLVASGTSTGWTLHDLMHETRESAPGTVYAEIGLSGRGEPSELLLCFSELPGVLSVESLDDDSG